METVLSICEQCAKAISEAAYKSYQDNDSSSYDGCRAEIRYPSGTGIHVTHDPKTGFLIDAYHKSLIETPSLDKAIVAYLEENTDPEAEWQEACNNDDHDCGTGLDSGFGSWQDYYDYMYS